MTIAITGATGQLGRLVVAGLKKKGVSDVIGLARSADKAKDLGIPVRIADYDKPETLAPALAGVNALLLISGSEFGKRAAQHKAIVTAAKKAGVQKIVYTSILHADTSPIDLAAEHRASEAEIKASGIPYTFLRNGWYTENYTGSIGGALNAGAFIGSAGNGTLSLAARRDYADAAVAVLTTPGHDGKVYELGGDAAVSLADFAAAISAASNKRIPYNDLPQAEYAKILGSFGLPTFLAEAIAGWDTQAAKGALRDDGKQLSKLIGRPTTPMAETVAEAVRAQLQQ